MTKVDRCRSLIVEYLPDDRRISVYGVEKEIAASLTTNALEAPIFLDDEAGKEGAEFTLDDEFARRLGNALLNVLALSYPGFTEVANGDKQPAFAQRLGFRVSDSSYCA
ncbi:hypothetical protein AWB67_05610 [Caballeronia terrestris]|uniref:Uncharacterized protein n=1 Tax=Caballeronia terrestris TaxID=1226301 RepID=A0A158KGS4_9BURK|nr:hypothetical protein [Caballeronia terrestris]SAL80336.1 hypothetical protein AWB67_05610 [Caballeronia terrestris]